MINLLPEENKEVIKREYFRRLLIVSSVFLFFNLLVGLVFLLPIFSSLRSQKKDFERQLEVSQALLEGGQAEGVASFVAELKQKMEVLEKGYNGSGKKSIVLKRILEKKVEGVSLEDFSFDETKVVIRGFSRDRSGLLEFVSLLEKDEVLKGVHSPTTNILKSKDIDFQIDVRL